MANSPNQIVGYLGRNRYELGAWAMTDEEVTDAVGCISDRLAIVELTTPYLNEKSRVSEAIQVFFEEFGYLPHTDADSSDGTADHNRWRGDVVHEQTSGIVDAIAQIDDAALRHYMFRLRIAIGSIDPRTSPNMLRGAEALYAYTDTDDAWGRAVQRAVATVMTLIHEQRASSQPTRVDKLALLPTDPISSIDELATRCTPQQAIELGKVLSKADIGEVTFDTLCALVLDMIRSDDISWQDILYKLEMAVDRINDDGRIT